MISTDLGELNGYFLLQRCRVPSKVAIVWLRSGFSWLIGHPIAPPR